MATISSELEVDSVDACAIAGSVCEAGTAFAIKVNNTEVYKFYVLSDNETKVTLIMDRDLLSGVEWISAEDYALANTDETSCSRDACNDEGPLTALDSLENSTSNWVNIPLQTYTLEDSYYKTITRKARARLINNIEAFAVASHDGISVGYYPSWLVTNLTNSDGYWTSNAGSLSPHNNHAYIISRVAGRNDEGVSGETTVTNSKNIRPVIELTK